MQERHAVLSRRDPHVRCLPDNPPRAWTLPHLTKAVHAPKLLILLYEVNAMYRQIFIDGRPFPDDPDAGMERLLGRALGRRHARRRDAGLPRRPVDRHVGQPDERRREDDRKIPPPELRHLEIELTIDDPKAYTRPFTVNLTQNLEADTELVDEFCLEGEKDYERLQRSRGK